MRTLTTLAAVLSTLILPTGCQEPPTGPPPDVDVVAVVEEDVPVRSEYAGRTEAFGVVELRAAVAGTLREAHVADGREVVPGEPLFLIDPASYQAAVDRALEQLQRSEGVLQRARDELERGRPRYAEGDMSDEAWARRQAAVRDAELLVQGDAGHLRRAQDELTGTRIAAPVAGILRAPDPPAVGATVGPDSGALASISQLHPIAVRFALDRADLLPTPAGARPDRHARTLELTLGDGATYPSPGRLDLPPSPDDEAARIEARGVFPNVESALVPGMDVTVALLQSGASTRKLLVPPSAIQEDWRGAYVLAVGRDNRLERRRITPGPTHGDLQIIESGLTPSDRILPTPSPSLAPGQQINPRPG